MQINFLDSIFHTRDLMARHFVLKSMTGKQVETDPGCDSARSSPSLTCICFRFPDLLEAFHALGRIIPEILCRKYINQPESALLMQNSTLKIHDKRNILWISGVQSTHVLFILLRDVCGKIFQSIDFLRQDNELLVSEIKKLGPPTSFQS